MKRRVDELRVVAVADTDSYVKWAAALLGSSRVDGRLVVLDTDLVVSDAQLDAALSGTGLDPDRVVRRAFAELAGELAAADVVLAAARGPLVRVVARVAAAHAPGAVIATGLPGISIPPTWLALHFRRACDIMLVHSRREVREFRALAEERGISQRFALATLPFARRTMAEHGADGGSDLVFAAQAIVPRERADRMRIARMLVRAAEADPSRRVVLKLRGRAGEQQTHREDDSYTDLLDELGTAPANLVVSYAPMHEALASAEGLVTVSSTAAIEAAAQGVRVIAVDDFGVDASLINVVFSGSGLLASSDEVIARRFRRPDPAWLDDNYFHDGDLDDWEERLVELVARRRAGALPQRETPRLLGGRARLAWERRLALGTSDRTAAGRAAYVIGMPARVALRVWRRTVLRPRDVGRPSAV